MNSHRVHSSIKFMKYVVLPVALTIACTLAPSGEVFADKVSDLQSQTQQTQSAISANASDQQTLENEQAAVASSIDSTNDEMVQNMASISLLQDQIDSLDDQIAEKQTEYDAAKAKEDEQYAAMKKRIKFMYEQGDIDYIQILAKASSFSDMLNKAEYVNQLYDYDRQMLQQFQDIQKDVQEKQAALESDKDEQETSKNEMEVEQAALQAQLNDLQAQYSDYQTRISEAQTRATTLAAQLKSQNAALNEAVEEQQKAEAAAKAAAEAARKAEEEAKAAADAQAKAAAEQKAKEAQAAADKAQKEADEKAQLAKQAEEATVATASSSSDSSSTSSESSSSSGSSSTSSAPASTASGVTGQDVVNYAEQFVGNPYVYGGTSLTNGTDCSGFTMSVYAHFGISLGRTDVAQRSNGIAVASLADAQPGDIICYPGHVALYVGNGTIVHASTAATGIKYSSATYRPYVTIRRLIY